MRLELVKVGPIMPGYLGTIFTLEALATQFDPAQQIGSVSLAGTLFQGTACTLKNDSRQLMVDFGEVDASRFTQIGSTPVSRSFTLNLGCTGVGNAPDSSVSIEFGGQPVAGNPDILEVTGSQPATGLGIRLMSQGQQMSLNQAHRVGTGSAWSDMSVPIVAQYYQTAQRVTAGEANGTLTLTIQMR